MSFVWKRVLGMLPSLIGIVLVTFLLSHALPVDRPATDASLAQLGARLGLDKNLIDQFFKHLVDLAHGHLGTSSSTGQPVLHDLLARLPASVELWVSALLVALAVALPLGVFAAARPGSWVDWLCRGTLAVGSAMPSFVVGLLLVCVFGFLFGVAPQPLVLPSVALGLALLAPIARVTRHAMLAALGSDFIRTARARDLSARRLLLTYAFRNALLPLLGSLGSVFGLLLGASILVEQVFGWPGIGAYAVAALRVSDHAAVQGVVLVMALVYLLLNLAADLARSRIDPRIRLGR